MATQGELHALLDKRHLRLTANHWQLVGGLEQPTGPLAGAQKAVDRHRARAPPHGQWLHRLPDKAVGYPAMGAAGNHDPARRGSLHQPGRKVHRVAHHSILAAQVGANKPAEDQAEGDADARAEG